MTSIQAPKNWRNLPAKPRLPRSASLLPIGPCDRANVLAAASTVEKEVRGQVKNGASKEAAGIVGKRIAERAKAAGVTAVAFDRSGFAYQGRIKALADAAREAGLTF